MEVNLDRQSGVAEIWIRFKKSKIALCGLYGIGLLFIIAVYAPLITGNLPLIVIKCNLSVSFPVLYLIFNPDGPEITIDKLYNYLIFFIPLLMVFLKFIKPKKGIKILCFIFAATVIFMPFCSKWHVKYKWNPKNLPSGEVVLKVMPPVPYSPYELSGMPYEKSSKEHWLGTDNIGRDIMSRIVFGARTSLAVGFFATLIALIIGTSVGLVSGYNGGVMDIIVMRIVEIVICFPAFLFLLILMASLTDLKFEQSCLVVILIIGLLSWTGFARIVRGEVLKQRNLAYVQACEIFGMSKRRIMFNHILPNILGPIVVTVIFAAAANILAESGLSFLGFGVQSPTASWGELLKEAFTDPLRYWNLTFWPGLIIFVTILFLNLIGENLRRSIGES